MVHAQQNHKIANVTGNSPRNAYKTVLQSCKTRVFWVLEGIKKPTKGINTRRGSNSTMFLEVFGLESFNFTIWGNTLEQFALFAATVIGFVLLGKVVDFVITNYIQKLTQKTKSNIDDYLLDIMHAPLQWLVTILGLSVGAELFLTFPSAGIESLYFNIVGALVLGAVTFRAVKAVEIFSDTFLKKLAGKTKSNLDDQLLPLFKKASKYLIVGAAILLALENFGYDITAIIAGLGIGGLAVAFAAQETIKDVFGGIVIFANKSFFVGDRVTVEGVTGSVETINMRTTKIRNWENRLVTVPNSKMASAVIENWSTAPARKTTLVLGLTYDTASAKLEKAKQIVRDIVNKTDGTLRDTDKEENVKIWFSEFADSSLNIKVIYYIEDQDNLLDIWDKVNTGIKKEFEKAGIEFAFPTQTIYLEK
jgi:MscS family membrane protein